MEVYTMVIVACISGEPSCAQARISETSFVTEAACEAAIRSVTSSMTKGFGADPHLKGKQVAYDVTCMNREQLRAKLGVTQVDL
jgi:hypothetical protein